MSKTGSDSTTAPPRLPPVEIRHLRYFLAVSEELHFRRAAERLHIAQPPLSQAIRRLEDGLGVRLLERTSRAVAPTEAGQVFAAEARKVLASLERAVAEARRIGGVPARPRMGCVTHLPMAQLQRFLDRLHRRDPHIQPEVMHLVTVEQLRRLRAGQLELGILYYVEDFEFDGIEVEPLFEGTEMVALVPEGHPAAAKERVSPDDLAGEELVLFSRRVNRALHDWLVERIAAAGYRFRGVHEASGTDPRDIVLAVAEGAGVALVPVVYEDAQVGGTVARRPLEAPVSAPPTVIGWHGKPPERLAAFIENARAVARELHAADRN
jgi:DNA-binding transcriptional LysR family regulator